jgi:hypothetical protein
MKRTWFALAVVSLGFVWVHAPASAQTAPLPYGTVEYIGHQGPNYAYSCPQPNSGWVNGTTCIDATMHCATNLYVVDRTFTYGYEAPTLPYKGTIVALSGGGGTTPSSVPGSEAQMLGVYLSDGFEIVQVKWGSDWEDQADAYPPFSYGNIQYAACRPAGLLHFVYTSTAANGANPVLFQPGGGMCAQGTSAGSAAIVYVLSWYGAGYGSTGYIDNVELVSGPVLSRVDLGCEVPVASNVTVCQGSPGCKMASGVQPWSVTPEYNDGYEKGPRQWSNIGACANGINENTSAWNSDWNAMSILSSSITSQQLSYPSTSMSSWLCGSVYQNQAPMNNSSSQGWFFYQQASFMTNNWFVNAVTNCDGPEGATGPDATGPDGVAGNVQNLITSDMEAQCKARTH